MKVPACEGRSPETLVGSAELHDDDRLLFHGLGLDLSELLAVPQTLSPRNSWHPVPQYSNYFHIVEVFITMLIDIRYYSWRNCTSMREKTKKATFNLSPSIIAALDEAMATGAASSKNALVERALARELYELHRKARRSRWEQGAKDPLLLRDIAETKTAYHSADAETAEGGD